MPVRIERKAEIIRDFARGANDSGSAEVQVALLTESVNNLTEHLARHPKDNSTRRGLLSRPRLRRALARPCLLLTPHDLSYHRVPPPPEVWAVSTNPCHLLGVTPLCRGVARGRGPIGPGA
jgi:small subunit ribosomal protein S15